MADLALVNYQCGFFMMLGHIIAPQLIWVFFVYCIIETYGIQFTQIEMLRYAEPEIKKLYDMEDDD